MSQLTFFAFKQCAAILRAVNHPLRQKILMYLEGNPACTVTELYTALRLEQSVASQHLAILRNAHMVLFDRAGKERRYSVNFAAFDHVKEQCMNITGKLK